MKKYIIYSSVENYPLYFETENEAIKKFNELKVNHPKETHHVRKNIADYIDGKMKK
jgi:hypothetical protein